ncbi:MAG TPA: hypothetical protein VEG66_08510 [Thermoplasmata archaeon]|jgi:F0F1-type ATP synthase assembly protein I|nr:hypothetical protein [Thermoplasmata archaeon]
MLRETTFLIGGCLLIALGALLALGLYLAGAGGDFANTWLAGGMSVVLGVFFVYVARAEHQDRRAFLEAAEKTPPEPPGPGRG